MISPPKKKKINLSAAETPGKSIIKVNNKTGNFQSLKKGASHGCMLSPDLFSFYGENIVRANTNNLIVPQNDFNGLSLNSKTTETKFLP